MAGLWKAIAAHDIGELWPLEFAKVEVDHLATGSRVDASMLNARSDLVVDNSLLVFADDVDTEFQHVLFSQLVGVRISVLL